MDTEDKKLLIENLSQDPIVKKAYQNMDHFRVYIEKLKKDTNSACAVLHQCTLDIVNNQNGEERERFLQNMAEYFFENLWQDDRR